MTLKERQKEAERQRRLHEKRVDDAFDDAEALVGPIRLPDGRPGEPETLLREAAKRLRKLDDNPWARDAAEECEDLAPGLPDEDEHGPPDDDEDGDD